MTNVNPIFDSASRWPHRLALVLCCATFPLVWIGGLVTTYQAGMAVPDWPNTYGYNLFLYPIETWFYGPWDVFIEHGHRLFASLVGVITIALCVTMWRTHQPRRLKILSLVALAAVIFQGVLGGLRVLLDQQTIAKIHGCFGPAFFALTAAIATVTSRAWKTRAQSIETPPANSLAMLAGATPVMAYLQLVLGAQLRHFDPASSGSVFRTFVVFHVVVAVALSVHIVITALCFGRKTPGSRPLIVPAYSLVVLIGCQLLLGVATWIVNFGWPAMFTAPDALAEITVQAKSWRQSQITTAHVAVGSLILAIATVHAVFATRLLKLQILALPQRATWNGAAAS